MRTDLKTILVALAAAAMFNMGCDDDGDSGGAGGAGGGNADGGAGMGGGAGGAGGEAGMGGGAGGAGGEAGMGGAGGAGGMMGPDCVAVCTTLGNCALPDICPGITEDNLQAFVDGCVETCGMQPALAALVNGDNCEGTINTLSNINASFREACQGGGGGEGGMGGAGGAGGMAGGGQIDRTGRPAVSTALIPSDMKDAYNQDGNAAAWGDTWSAVLTASLTAVDGLGGGDPLLPPAAVGPVLADDFLLLDASKPYAADGYLTVELALVGVIPEGTSGGRSLSQNVVDVTLSALVGTPLDSNWDCVDANDRPFQMMFPYLANPN